jgi:hypothetical protein
VARSGLNRGKPLKRTRGPKQRTPIRQRNPKRLRKRRGLEFGEKAVWIRTLPCVLCKRRPSLEDPMTASHVKSRGSGGKSDSLVPMCPRCHGEYECRKAHYNMAHSLPEIARRLEALWQQMEGTR